ncbi:MAG: rod shape-determining protein RodA [Nitrospirae bacterium]|nr:rod shape-determining protein RodA [Nitrospirota bacterium]
MIDRNILKKFDWSIIVVALAISLIGVITIYSATRPILDAEQQSFYMKQIYWICLSLLFFFLVVSIDYMWFIRYAYFIYSVGVFLLIAVLIIGRKGMGAQRWIPLGFFSFQPSEFFKIFFVLAISRYFSGIEQKMDLDFKGLAKVALIFFAVPAILIFKQPDLGTVMILSFIFISVILTAGTKKKLIVVGVIIGLISLPFVGNIFWGGLKTYQKNRLIAFIDPSVDPQGVGYHINQSKVSVGSGGFTGKGYMKGTQGYLRFLPEKHTDFIFSVFAEEWGFAGSIILFVLYLFIILRGLDTAIRARDPAGSFLALGVTSMLFFYFVVNVGMTLGIVPVVGVPLPFMSYGGTALLSNFLAIGILTNVRMRRYALFY